MYSIGKRLGLIEFIKKNGNLMAGGANGDIHEILKPFWENMKNEIRMTYKYDPVSSGFTKDIYRREKQLLISRLHVLLTNAHKSKVATTQTVLSGDKITAIGPVSGSHPTEECIKNFLNSENLHLTIDRISNLVMQKLAIQKETEMKLFQKSMKDQKNAAIRKVKETQRRKLEKLKQNHNLQMKNIESENAMHIERLKTSANQTKEEKEVLSDKLDSCERELRSVKASLVKIQAENRMLSEENRMFKQNLAKQREENENLYKTVLLFNELEDKLKKCEETNEMILQQFHLLETERDELVEAIRHGIYDMKEVNRLGDRILAAEIAKTENQIKSQKGDPIAGVKMSSFGLLSETLCE
uniref:Uncharacterized protein n=1 Tax=Setaria digitata TaxID=48799 RepID=A0A915Q148_9BILA